MAANKHHAHVYRSLEQLLSECVFDEDHPRHETSVRFWTKVWKKHVEKHGNVPLIQKCYICSGTERKCELKSGRWKPGRNRPRDED